ncbi:MAG: ABC transporter substrate-binding protein [Oscillochloris sp.]|nr:ABC transporter substrate-binding protein [Oscillochloris sp.]
MRIANLPLFRAGTPKARSRQRQRRSEHTASAPATIRLKPRRSRRLLVSVLLICLIGSAGAGLLIWNRTDLGALAQQSESVELAVELPLSGDSAQSGTPPYEGIQLAIEEANASDQRPLFKLTTYDDQGSSELARGLADQIVASQALVVLGPAFSTTALATGPTYAQVDLVSLPTNATSDQITENASTFRVLFKNSDQGELLAHYLVRVLGERRAAVFVIDTSYGQTLREGFARAATLLDLQADYYVFSDTTQISQMARQVAKDPQPPPVVLLTLDREGAQLLVALRKLGLAGPFLAGDSLGKESFTDLVKNQPEEQSQPGFFTSNLYALAPMILDSASAETLAFAERYRARFGHDPNWSAVAGYDAATLAIAAVRATMTDPAVSHDLATRREAVGIYLRSLDRPERALPGLLGPFWFDQQRARQQAIRVGRFRGGRFESAPIQIVTLSSPDSNQIAAGSAFDLGSGRYARLQLVSHTGVFLNEISQVDPLRSSFTADFYLWMRFARNGTADSIDPTNLRFPDLVTGSFHPDQPMQRLVLADGSEYWLWRIQGEFRSLFDQQRFPFDQQTLVLSFFNPNATAEQLIYAVDTQKRAELSESAAIAPNDTSGIVAFEAFNNLKVWRGGDVRARRQNLITNSNLGNPTSSDLNAQLDLSGFVVTVDLERQGLIAFSNTVLPLIVLSVLMFGSLFLPSVMVSERVLVAAIAALCGMMPLTALNNQLGSVGYTIMLGNVFYVYFGLALLCGITALGAWRLRTWAYGQIAAQLEIGTRIVFLVTISITVALTMLYLWY